MTSRQRIVVDTNALVSRLLIPNSVQAQAIRKAVDTAQLRLNPIEALRYQRMR